MGEFPITTLSLENHRPSTILSMDSSASSSHDDLDLEMNRQGGLTRPPDINLPLSVPLLQPWSTVSLDMLDVGLGSQLYENETFISLPKVGKKYAKRVDSIWGAWFFFSFYFKPVLNEKSKAKVVLDHNNGFSGFDKSDLQIDTFMVQHDMENMYMWVFKERPENALGKMQLRSFMNGHSRQGDRPFPFCADKGFVRSHRMQRKHYRGLSNPQCVHGIEVVPSPNLKNLDEADRKRWVELTGRDINFSVPPEASDFGSWRNLPAAEFETTAQVKSAPNSKKLLNGNALNWSTQPTSNISNGGDSMDLSPASKRRKKEFLSHGDDSECCYLTVNNPPVLSSPETETYQKEPHWLNDFKGVMRNNVYGPVTAAKSIYEDEKGYLIMISLPFVDLQRVKVSWRNTLTHGIIKVSCLSTSRVPYIKRHDRTFKLADSSSEHCPPGEFIREISLSTRIPEDANIEAYYDGPGTALEIMVPKLPLGPEEHEVRVCLRPQLGNNHLMLA